MKKKLIILFRWFKSNWTLLLFCLILLLFLVILFTIEWIKRDSNGNNLTTWQNIFIGFVASDVTIISIFFGAFIPILIGNVKDRIPLTYFNVIKNNFFNKKKFLFVVFMLILHTFQLIFCIFSVYYEPILIIFILLTGLYYLSIFFNGYQIFTKFNYAYYFSKQIDQLFVMIKNDILKNKLNKKRINKYSKKINFIIMGFPDKKIHFEELGHFKIELGIQLYYFAINIFSNGLFLYERFSFFKKNIPLVNIKYLKDNGIQWYYQENTMEELIMNKLVNYYSLCNKNELNKIFNEICVNKNIILFGNLSYYGMAFLTKLHVNLSKLKSWEIDLTWITFLWNFIIKNSEFVMINSKKELKIENKKVAKKYIVDNIYINPGLFFFYNKINNDKKVLKKKFNKKAFKMLHTYAAIQALFAIGKFSMENEKNIKIMLTLENFKKEKFVFNEYIMTLSKRLKELKIYVERNKKIKNDNKMYWIDTLEKMIENAKIKITYDDIKNIKIVKYDEISDIMVEKISFEILNSIELQEQGALEEWINKLYNYILNNIQNEINEFNLYNLSKNRVPFIFPHDLIDLFRNLLRVQLAASSVEDKYFQRVIDIILHLKKIRPDFLSSYNPKKSELEEFINQKFNLKKEIQENKYFPYYPDYPEKNWFDLNYLTTENKIRDEKIKWEKLKKSK